jgi:hypothetical protein
LIRTTIEGDCVNSKNICKFLKVSLGWLKQHFFDLIFQIASISIENVFTKFVESAVLNAMLYSQSFEEDLKAFLVSAAEIGRITCTTYFESN